MTGKIDLIKNIKVEVKLGGSWVNINEYNPEIGEYIVDSIDVSRGRGHELKNVDTGTADIQVSDVSRVFDPTNTEGPYYGLLEPLNRIRIIYVDEDNITGILLFAGRVKGWPVQWDNHIIGKHAIKCVDFFSALAREESVTVFKIAGQVAGLEEETSGERVKNILFSSGDEWDDPEYSIQYDEGITVCARVEDSEQSNPLQEIQRVVNIEHGMFYAVPENGIVSSADSFKFNGRHSRLKPRDIIKAIFGTEDKGVQEPVIAVEDFGVTEDDSEVRNIITIRSDDIDFEWTDFDQESIDKFGPRKFELEGPYSWKSAVETHARELKRKFAWPHLRIEDITWNPIASNKNLPILGDIVLGSRIKLRFQPHRGSLIEREQHVEEIKHTIGKTEWRTTYGLSPANELFYWVLGDTTYGRIGETARLAF